MDINKIIESLSPNERKILPYLGEDIINICKKASLDKVSVMRALGYLQNKEIINLDTEKKKVVEIGVNGALYHKKGLPERRLLNVLDEKKIINLKDAQILSKLSDDEFKASIGVLKKKAMIELKKGKIFLSSSKGEITRKFLEEIFLEILPIGLDSLSPEQMYAFKSLKERKDIINIEERKDIKIKITELGKKIISSNEKYTDKDLIETISPNILRDEKFWKGKKFRRYDVTSSVPAIFGGKKHFVNQAIEYGKKIWTDMGFKEMTGNMVQSSFWNFDALFTAQDHPVREMQDTFFINKITSLPADKNLVANIKKSHEKGIDESKGWNYQWKEEEAEKTVLRTHTTSLSARKLYELSKNLNKNLPAKFFAIGKCFRNESVDWSHGFEFNQSEGIVIDENANFRHLLGYLKQFYKMMGFEKIRFSPAYFPYTEPSVEINWWHPQKKVWLEIGGAGMFRPELTIPLLGRKIPVLAWGPGFDRIIMNYFDIKDLREVYKNDIAQLRKIKFWMKQ